MSYFRQPNSSRKYRKSKSGSARPKLEALEVNGAFRVDNQYRNTVAVQACIYGKKLGKRFSVRSVNNNEVEVRRIS